MHVKITSFLKIIWYSMRFGSKIHFCGFSQFHEKAKINLKCGVAVLGRGLTLKTGAYLAIVNNGKLEIGDYTHIGRNCNIVCHESIKIGNHCALGPNIVIYDHDHCFGRYGLKNGFRTAPITIGDNCWVGAGAIILRGSTIGEGSVIGAGAIVKGNIPPYSLVTSNRELVITSLNN